MGLPLGPGAYTAAASTSMSNSKQRRAVHLYLPRPPPHLPTPLPQLHRQQPGAVSPDGRCLRRADCGRVVRNSDATFGQPCCAALVRVLPISLQPLAGYIDSFIIKSNSALAALKAGIFDGIVLGVKHSTVYVSCLDCAINSLGTTGCTTTVYLITLNRLPTPTISPQNHRRQPGADDLGGRCLQRASRPIPSSVSA